MDLPITVGFGDGANMSLGTSAPGRAGQQGDLIVSQLQAAGFEATIRSHTFHAANQAAATTTVGLATTYTGLCLSNPVGSGFNLVVGKVGYAFIVAFPAGAAIGLMTGYNATTNVTHTTPATPRNGKFGTGAAGVGLVDVAATLPTAPVLTHLFGSGLTGAITTAPHVSQGLIDLEGTLVLPPGAYCAIYTSTVSGTSGFLGSISWTEVPA